MPAASGYAGGAPEWRGCSRNRNDRARSATERTRASGRCDETGQGVGQGGPRGGKGRKGRGGKLLRHPPRTVARPMPRPRPPWRRGAPPWYPPAHRATLPPTAPGRLRTRFRPFRTGNRPNASSPEARANPLQHIDLDARAGGKRLIRCVMVKIGAVMYCIRAGYAAGSVPTARAFAR